MLHTNLKLAGLASSLALAFGLSACAPKNQSVLGGSNGVLNLVSIQANKELSNQEKAERLAEAAERLLLPGSFMYSHDIAEAALAIDPENRKARLIHALTAPAMELKGIFTRIEPLAKSKPAQYGEFKRFTRDLKRSNPESAVTRFLFDGPKDIHTEREFQEVVARFTAKLDELRLTLKNLKNGPELSIYINEPAFKEMALNNAIKNCVVREIGPMYFDISRCDLSSAYERKLNRADFEMLQHIVAGYQVYLTILNGWDLSGVYAKSHLMTDDPNQVMDLLFQDPQFGTLRETHGYGAIPETLQDALIGAQYALDMQPSLCRMGVDHPNNRPGYAFENGLCISRDNDLDTTLVIIEKMLQGPTEISLTSGDKEIKTTIDALAPIRTPIADLRSLRPTELDACGQVTKIGDSTVGGLFPNGDFNDIIAEGLKPCHQ